ncbi:MAG: hypothetical protein IJP08_05270 [Bacteroidaceae bacterium]|nr:hypothetical protein [Bacteroidaceae bacterium]
MKLMSCLLWTVMLLAGMNMQAAGVRTKLSNRKASKEAKAMYKQLLRIHEAGKTLSGQMWAPWGIDEIEYVHEVTGKYPAVRGHDLIHEGSNAREVELLTEWYRRGGIPTLMWHWGAPTKGEGYEQSKMSIDVARCFEEGTPEYKAMWADLDRVAGWLEKLKEAKVPVLWRPMHECGTLPDPDECKQNGTVWMWWMLWHTSHVTGHDKGELKRIYHHPDVLTLDEMEDW